MSTYARKPVPRSTAGFTESDLGIVFASDVVFPTVASGSGTALFFGVGLAQTGDGELLFSVPLPTDLVIQAGATPTITAGTFAVQVGLGNVPQAVLDLIELMFQNVAWPGFGDTGGLLGSAAAGNLVISLHTLDPAASGLQSAYELAYD